ncbi:MAG: hypothetical protein R2750_02530 [Bacteroidales bacterium]
MTINGNVTVDDGASITVGNGVTNTSIGVREGSLHFSIITSNFHTVIVRGNFTNYGSVSFTNLSYPIYNAFPPTSASPTSQGLLRCFQGSSNNTLNCYGPTTFYNLILDKGIDQTSSSQLIQPATKTLGYSEQILWQLMVV